MNTQFKIITASLFVMVANCLNAGLWDSIKKVNGIGWSLYNEGRA